MPQTTKLCVKSRARGPSKLPSARRAAKPYVLFACASNRKNGLPCQDSFLRHADSASSFCSGCGTAEMARAVLERDINESGKVPFSVSIPSVALWDPRP